MRLELTAAHDRHAAELNEQWLARLVEETSRAVQDDQENQTLALDAAVDAAVARAQREAKASMAKAVAEAEARVAGATREKVEAEAISRQRVACEEAARVARIEAEERAESLRSKALEAAEDVWSARQEATVRAAVANAQRVATEEQVAAVAAAVAENSESEASRLRDALARQESGLEARFDECLTAAMTEADASSAAKHKLARATVLREAGEAHTAAMLEARAQAEGRLRQEHEATLQAERQLVTATEGLRAEHAEALEAASYASQLERQESKRRIDEAMATIAQLRGELAGMAGSAAGGTGLLVPTPPPLAEQLTEQRVEL